ncbi:MAG: hypothetical protein Q9160_000311 [Pyrenula sp. 1 TL-2023]
MLMVTDDSLKRLAPSLEQYRNCDVIDINPGVCVWSAKLHDYLQPRRHLLVEPDRDLYYPYIDPLLNAPNSRYQHVSLETKIYNNTDKLLGHGLLPKQDEKDPLNTSDRRVNQSLLVTLNLTSRAGDRSKHVNYIAQSTYSAYSLLKSYLTNSVLNKYGLVRVLMWAPHSQARQILPTSAVHRGKDSIVGELCGEAELITCSQEFLDRDPREHRVRVQDYRQVLSRMEQERVIVPRGRQVKLKEPGFLDIPRSEILSLLKSKSDYSSWVQEWLSLEDRFARGEISMSKVPSPKDDVRHRCYSRIAKQLRIYRQRYDFLMKQRKTIHSLLGRRFDLDDNAGDDNAQIESKYEAIDNEAQKLIPHARGYFNLLLDDYRISKDRTTGLQWTRRHAEPLINHDEEFFPRQSLSLIDFRPRLSTLKRIDDNEKATHVLYVFDRLFYGPGVSLSKFLEEFAPGIVEYSVANVPALQTLMRDWHAGVSGIRARSVPSDVLLEIALAWHSWPFRVSTDILQRDMPISERASLVAAS